MSGQWCEIAEACGKKSSIGVPCSSSASDHANIYDPPYFGLSAPSVAVSDDVLICLSNSPEKMHRVQWSRDQDCNAPTGTRLCATDAAAVSVMLEKISESA